MCYHVVLRTTQIMSTEWMNECLMTPQHKHLFIHSFIHSYERKEGNVLFNDALNIWCWTYGKGPLSENENLPLPHELFLISRRVLLYAISNRQDITYHSLCYTICGALAGTRHSSMIHNIGSIWWPITPWTDALRPKY